MWIEYVQWDVTRETRTCLFRRYSNKRFTSPQDKAAEQEMNRNSWTRPLTYKPESVAGNSAQCAPHYRLFEKKRQSMWSIRAVEQERPDQYELPERTPHACNEYFCISWQRRGGQVQPEWWSLGASCFYFPRRSSCFSLSQPAERKEPPSSALKRRLRMKRLVWSPQLLRFCISVFTMSVVITLKLCLRFLVTVTMNCFNVGLHHILDVHTDSKSWVIRQNLYFCRIMSYYTSAEHVIYCCF